MQIQSKYDVIIIGAGVYGLSIAYYLSKNQDIKIALLEQYSIGHVKGSSHSTTRITRSLYEKQVYRDLNTHGLNNNWKEMESVLKEKIVNDNQFVYFDQFENSYNNFKRTAQGSQPKNVQIFKSQEEYQKYYQKNFKKFPLIKSNYPPILDKKAGIIYASLYVKKLYEYLKQNRQNVTILQHTIVKSLNQNKKQINVETQTDILRAQKVILACGKWIKELAPEVSDLLWSVKQYVGYLELQESLKYKIGAFPSFVHNDKTGKNYYSVPIDSINKVGVKLAQHKDQPQNQLDLVEQKLLQQAYEDLRKKALQYFGQNFIQIKTVEECYYTVTKSSDFIIDWIGQNQKILVCSCCSGHGFKFAPILGQIISQLVVPQKNEQNNQNKQGQIRIKIKSKLRALQIYNKWQHMFRIGYHRGLNLI